MSQINHHNLNEDQEKLTEAMTNVKKNSFQMKLWLDKGKLMEALKSASNMLSELRTSLLGPKAYYELYMNVCDQLVHLESYLLDEFNRGRKLADLYELVQYAGNIIPRLYLLIIVGLVYMKTTAGCRRDILRDLVEMCRGVQHPLRGLFLRNYLLRSCRNVLPDVTVEDVSSNLDGKEDHSGTVEDSIEFILLNFAEMNKLWVRMQHQGHSRDRERREKERLELRELVGTNLVRLSQLDTIDIGRYEKIVLPGILEQVVSCRDGIAQEYLMECLIHVFSDEYHLSTLSPFLKSCAQLVDSVNVKNIIIALIDRLASSKDIELPDDLFDTFSKQIMHIKMSRPTMPLEDIILMQGSLINFSIKKISDLDKREQSMDSVLGATLNVINEKLQGNKILYNSTVGKELLKFLTIPITPISSLKPNCMTAIKLSLKLKNFKEILKQVCDFEIHKQIAIFLLNIAIDSELDETVIEENRLSLEEIDLFLNITCEPLRIDQKHEQNGQSNISENSMDDLDDEFIEEQNLMARFLHFMLSPVCVSKDLDDHYLILSSAKKSLKHGSAKHIKFTFPSIVNEALNLALKYSNEQNDKDPKWEEKCSKIFKFVHTTIKTLMEESSCAYLCLKLFLQAALNASKTKIKDHETFAYNFISQAFSIYEEEIVESKQQLAFLLLMIGSLKEINFKQEENLNPLRSQCSLNSSKLVKKSDQVKAILNSTVLFFNDNQLESSGIKLIKKCIKITTTTLDQELQVQLYVDILSHLTLFADSKNKDDILELVNGLKEKIEELKQDVSLTDLLEKQYSNNLQIWNANEISNLESKVNNSLNID